MSSKLEEVRSIKKRAPRVRPTLTKTSYVFTKYIGKMKVNPAEQIQMSLGVFGADRPEKGFSIELSPDPDPVDSVVSEILAVGSATRYELFLVLANYGVKALTAEVWRI